MQGGIPVQAEIGLAVSTWHRRVPVSLCPLVLAAIGVAAGIVGSLGLMRVKNSIAHSEWPNCVGTNEGVPLRSRCFSPSHLPVSASRSSAPRLNLSESDKTRFLNN
jgi:hypothetical protein